MSEPVRPSDCEIKAALARILASSLFARSERLRDFLRYVVRREIEGEGQQLKGYTIGIDVFGRPPAFNADSDPLVRVHAGKLRKQLSAYYEDEGAGEPFRIVIAKGTYVPAYIGTDHQQPAIPQASPAVTDTQPPRQKPAVQRRGWRPAPFSSPVAILSVLPLLLFVPLTSSTMSVNATGRPGLASSVKEHAAELPRIRVIATGPHNPLAQALADGIQSAAAHYPTVTTAPKAATWPDRMGSRAQSFTIAVSPDKDATSVHVAIQSPERVAPIFETSIAASRLDEEADILYESLSLAAQALSVNGQIFRYAASNGTASALMRCMALTDTYRRQQSREAFSEAKSCQDSLSMDSRSKLRFVISARALSTAARN